MLAKIVPSNNDGRERSEKILHHGLAFGISCCMQIERPAISSAKCSARAGVG